VNAASYIEFCVETLRAIHPGLRVVNRVAYEVGDVRFVHVVHPSGASGRHIKNWLEGKTGAQPEKREAAVAAVRGEAV
jgi:hypothetical protein